MFSEHTCFGIAALGLLHLTVKPDGTILIDDQLAYAPPPPPSVPAPPFADPLPIYDGAIYQQPKAVDPMITQGSNFQEPMTLSCEHSGDEAKNHATVTEQPYKVDFR